MDRVRTDAGGLGDRIRGMGGGTVRLIVDYVKQETLDPLKGLGRFVVFGVAGSVALAIGVVIAAVGVLRLLQGETGGAFHGNWSWAPYLICAVAVVAVAVVAVAGIQRGQASRPTGRSEKKEIA